MTRHFGARQDEWDHFIGLGLLEDLLPVVSDPAGKISPFSSLKALGKVPSTFTAMGEVIGLPEWTRRRTTTADVTAWAGDRRLGICIQTRILRAIDIDVEDREVADEIEAHFIRHLGVKLPARIRSNSGKRLLAVRVPGPMRKMKFSTATGAVELLADGCQFVGVGTHPSGIPYVWAGGLPSAVPEVTQERLLDVKLTPFHGHLTVTEEESQSAQVQTAVPGGVSPTDHRAGPCWQDARGAVAGVRPHCAEHLQLDRAGRA